MDINYINKLLLEGKTVKEVRVSLGISEKRFQKEIKDLGYKYNQREKQYMKELEPLERVLEVMPIKTTNSPTKAPTMATTLSTTQTTTIDYLADNIDILKQLLENYKKNTESNNRDIVINLVSDKHLDPKPKSIRINEFVWKDWLTFTKDLTYSKGDLVSQALIEFMKNHK